MIQQESAIVARVEPKTYPLGENGDLLKSPALALVALSHSSIEHRLYSAMLSAPHDDGSNPFTARKLMALTNIRSRSSVRRGLEGLLSKLSIERHKSARSRGEAAVAYVPLPPQEIIARRKQQGVKSYENGLAREGNHSFERAIARVSENPYLSRREAQVALCCVEGLTNAEIGSRLDVSEQTVKFHLRHVFVKFGVKRRAELISRLLM